MWQNAWRFIKILFAMLIFGVVSCGVFVFRDDFLIAEARGATVRWEYALYENNSQATLRERLFVWELPFVEGKSVVLCFANRESAEEYINALLDKTGACIIFNERCADTESRYAYATGLGKGLRLSQGCVNLHIAQRGTTVCVGTPIIFGGY